MKTIFSKIRLTYIFNVFAIILIIISIAMGIIYEQTQKEIVQINHKANMEHLGSLSNNLKLDITRIVQKDFCTSLKNDIIIREYIESNLKLFITSKYKYIYLIAKPNKDKNNFIYLTDNEYPQKWTDLEKNKYLTAWKSKQNIYFKSADKHNLLGTYISPIIIEKNVKALLVIKFSLKEQNTILLVLNSLGKLFAVVFGFFIFIFISILWFSRLDKRREEQKNLVFQELQKSNSILNRTSSKLQIETQKLNDLNENLAKKVTHEVEKNRAKDMQLMQQARLAQMGEMISMIAHQWRQPLNAISATSSSLKLKTKLNKLDNEYVLQMSNNILTYVQHLSETIDDFRRFFRPNKEKSDTNYKEIMSSVHKLVSVSLNDHNIAFTKKLECEETLHTYPNELKHVILNLIKNAEDVLLERDIKHASIHIYTYKDGENCILEVQDNGGGIEESIKNKIFDPYFSTKLEKDGTGLGLYMSKMIIEEHCKGHIVVENSEDGVVFKIILGKKYE